MKTWGDYKEHIINSSPNGAEEVAEIEALSKSIGDEYKNDIDTALPSTEEY